MSKLASEAEYLAEELCSQVKRDYLAGRIYAWADTTNLHNEISGNILVALKVRLRGRPCRPHNSDTKLRLQLDGERFFYYPDVTVTCRQNPPDDSFQDAPAAIFEVLSESTRRIDEREKKVAYLAQESLGAYVLVETQIPKIVLWRRTEKGFVREDYEGLDAVIPLPELNAELPLSEVYEEVDFAAENQG